jgi:hypothetical protein
VRIKKLRSINKSNKTAFFLLTLLLAFSVFGQKKVNSSEEREKQDLIRLTKEISRASIEKDAATLNRLMDDNFVMLGVSNKYFRKSELVKFWTKTEPNSDVSESSTPDDIEVFLYDKTAVVISTITDVERDFKSETITKTKTFDVWKKSKKGWRWISSRETLLTPKNEEK